MAYKPNAALQGAPFGESVARFWKRYATFTGRASRAEFWWAMLFNLLAGLACAVLDIPIAIGSGQDWDLFSSIYGLATILPGLAIGVRRLHDIDRRGWWIFLWLLPLIGAIVMIVFHCQRGTDGPNRFGDTEVA